MFTINCRGKLHVYEKPVVMGILNITPDSFYEGHISLSMDELISKAANMLAQGAGIIDIGGQSTRPGSARLSAPEEWARVQPVLKNIRSCFPDAVISIDTYHSQVAREAVAMGADIINDISAGTLDQEMIPTVGTLNVPYICMHMKGSPEHMQDLAMYEDITREVLDYFIRKIDQCQSAGIKDIIIDPGFGFAKNIEQNFRLLHELHALRILGKPILAGLSRKSSIYKTLGITPDEAVNGTTV
ncbi:MAG TPA: dihydropteroate synthase, partial [Ferruginibacter sp.]|nr:dihydropteroate synthase [Ferruginibacter sp.]